MTDLSQLSKEAKESFLNSKMEEIRKKNEELKKRHAEIEADKRNAELNSHAAYLKQTAQEAQQPKLPKPPGLTTGLGRGKRIEKSKQEKLQAPDVQKRKQRLSEDENPPPDPAYNFLHDRSREGKEAEDRKLNSRRHVSNFGGQDFANVKNTMQIRKTHEKEHPLEPPRSKMEQMLRMTGRERKEYENWRIERDRVETERIARQKTATGEWRREWDKDKIAQEEQDIPWPSPSLGSSNGFRGRGRGVGRGNQKQRGGRHWDHMPQENASEGRGSWRGRGRGNFHNDRRHFDNDNRAESKEAPIHEQSVLSDEALDHKVYMALDSLKISFSNDYKDNPEAKASTETPIGNHYKQAKRVGSGRILSTSSQSDDDRSGSSSDYKPSKRGGRSRGRYIGERGGSRPAQRNVRQGRGDRLPVFEKTDIPSVLDIRKDQSSALLEMARGSDVEMAAEPSGFKDDSKDTDEVWETGDDLWEDITTSGNESLELSGSVDETQSFAGEREAVDASRENLNFYQTDATIAEEKADDNEESVVKCEMSDDVKVLHVSQPSSLSIDTSDVANCHLELRQPSPRLGVVGATSLLLNEILDVTLLETETNKNEVPAANLETAQEICVSQSSSLSIDKSDVANCHLELGQSSPRLGATSLLLNEILDVTLLKTETNKNEVPAASLETDHELTNLNAEVETKTFANTDAEDNHCPLKDEMGEDLKDDACQDEAGSVSQLSDEQERRPTIEQPSKIDNYESTLSEVVNDDGDDREIGKVGTNQAEPCPTQNLSEVRNDSNDDVLQLPDETCSTLTREEERLEPSNEGKSIVVNSEPTLSEVVNDDGDTREIGNVDTNHSKPCPSHNLREVSNDSNDETCSMLTREQEPLIEEHSVAVKPTVSANADVDAVKANKVDTSLSEACPNQNPSEVQSDSEKTNDVAAEAVDK